MKYLINFMITLSLFLMTNIAKAQNCIPIDSDIVYTISPNIEACLDTQTPITLISSFELNTSIFSVQSIDASEPQMMFPNEWMHISGTFTIKLTKEMYLYRNKNIVLLMDKDEIIRTFAPMSFKAKIPTGTGAAITSAVTSADEGPRSSANNVVGSVAGNIVGTAVVVGTRSPIAGEIAAGVTGKFVTDSLNNHRPQIHPSFDLGSVGHFSSGHGGGGMGGNCISCHDNN
ncbi:hypothetical protein [Photobacterium damselae]|nr:hypothetical protein [Photobacterium damselae]MBE8127722.1 hypothetical protein [Photobacterium damselae subsp. piscicida]MCG3826271.1 hypothetical protein [Photobacterium damselae]TLS87010.1 hypothetical protein FD720_09320 [Photobacterium damselae subsp. damselae]WIH21987.1 hypothetical protein KQY33_20125 [Photobacterium damselae]